MIILTNEQARQIEEALEEAKKALANGCKWLEDPFDDDEWKIGRGAWAISDKALSTIRAARVQEQAENTDWKKASYIRETLNSEQKPVYELEVREFGGGWLGKTKSLGHNLRPLIKTGTSLPVGVYKLYASINRDNE